MRKVEFALLVLRLTLTAVGSEGRECDDRATVCDLDKRVGELEDRMKHCIDRLSSLGEFEKKAESHLALLDGRVKEMRGRLPENLLIVDRPDSGSQSEENVTFLLKAIDEENRRVGNLSGQIHALQSQKNLLKVDLENEKRHRRFLTEQMEKMERRLRETGSWKTLMDDIRIRLDNLSEPTNNLTFRLSLLIEERDDLKWEIENGKTVLKNLETHILWLEKELNETNNLKDNVDDLRGKMDQLQSNITDQTVDKVKKMIEVKLAGLDKTDDEKTMEEKMKMLEYQLEDRQNNVSTLINRTLNTRVSKVEQLLSALSSYGETESDQPWKEEMAEIKETVDTWTNVTADLLSEIRMDLDATTKTVWEINSTSTNGTYTTLLRLTELEKELTILSQRLREWKEWGNNSVYQVEQLRSKLENLDEKVEELNEKTDFLRYIYLNASLDRNSSSLWEEEVSEMKRNVSRLEEYVEELAKKTKKEWRETKAELDHLNLSLVNLVDVSDDRQRNASEVDFRLKRVERTLSEIVGLANRLRKMETGLNKTAKTEDLIQHDEKIVRLFVDVGKLRGRTEDLDRKLDGWSSKIVEAKNWVAEHVDREHKKLEKRIFRHREDLTLQFERSMEEKIGEIRSEIQKTVTFHDGAISCLLNQSNWCDKNQMLTSVTDTADQKFCTLMPDRDINLVITYDYTPVTLSTIRISEGEELVFRCSHVGRYALRGPPKIVCRRGAWSSDFPVCKKLADEEDIKNSQNVEIFCQSSGNGRHLYPLDCRQYYNCMEETFRIQSCPLGLFFDEKSTNCVHRQFSDCIDSPAIDFFPLPGTSNIPIGVTRGGTLVVFPGQNLSLTCIRPVEFSSVKWKIKTEDVVKTHLPVLRGRLELKRVNESDSGTYSCVQTEDQEHGNGIRIRVKAVFCPEMTTESPVMADDLVSRRLSSKVQFSCPDNYTLKGAAFVVCLADGHWSNRPPVCQPKGCLRPNTTGDPWIKLSPDLSFYPIDDKVMLDCQGDAPATDIPAFVRCLQDERWHIQPFPSCHN